MNKTIIYQVLPRLWGNDRPDSVKRGSLEENGTGKMSAIDSPALEYLKWLGCSHVWYTGIIRHSTKAASQGCLPSHPQFVKGEAGSPYAITDYYDVNPYLADNPENRMQEFEALVKRTHDAGLKVLIDFVPNHVARDYAMLSSNAPDPFMQLGCGDDDTCHWKAENDFFYYPGQNLVLPNEKDFNTECKALKNADLAKEYKILPAWLIAEARKIASQNNREQFDKFLSDHSQFLKPYREAPAKATGNVYTPTPTINDWYETVKINYCDNHTKTWDKMLAILEFWISKGVDGFRCDMVELVPPQFFKWAIAKVKEEHPEIIFVAEVYKKELYKQYVREVGFDLLYDKSGIYDTLRTVMNANSSGWGMPIELWQSTRGITRNWQFLGDLQPYMLNFLENHDEQRFPSEFFGKKAENTFAPLHAALFLNRSAFMIYAGEETGEAGMDEEGFSGRDGRTTIFDWWSVKGLRILRKIIALKLYPDDAVWPDDLEEYHDYFMRFTKAIRLASTDAAVACGTTYDLCYCNSGSEGFDIDRHFAFLRDSGNETILFAINFSQKEAKMKLFIPEHAFEWLEMEQTEKLNFRTPIEITVPPYDGIAITLCQ